MFSYNWFHSLWCRGCVWSALALRFGVFIEGLRALRIFVFCKACIKVCLCLFPTAILKYLFAAADVNRRNVAILNWIAVDGVEKVFLVLRAHS